MVGRWLVGIAASIALLGVAVLLVLVLAVGSVFGTGSSGTTALVMSQAQLAGNTCPLAPVTPIDTSKVKGTTWSAVQKQNAAQIVAQVKVDIPGKDQFHAAVIALATSMQESTLINVGYGDKAGPDSRGLFQQRAPWAGKLAWTPQDPRMIPAGSAHLFLTGGLTGQPGLLDISGWQSMPVTVAAQKVQGSAYPSAYAKWEGPATVLAAAFMGTTPPPTSDPCGGQGGAPGSTLPASPDTEKMLGYAKSLLGTPYVYGGTTYPPGVDCSGLLVYSWKKAGHPLRIRTSEQMWDTSTPLAAGTEKRGDLVFSEFVGGTKPGHVMIVWDPAAGTVIEAPHTGDVVKFLHYKTLPGIKFGRLKAEAFSR